jgi:mRNA interferase MazF
MALLFHPRAGQVFVCDFTGFKEPEMVKPRPVIIVSPRLPYRSEIAAIVPISLTPPRHNLPFCYRLSKNYHPDEPDDLPCWAKADLLLNIGTYRLSAFKVGRRKYAYPTLTPEDLGNVRRAVLCGLGLDRPLKVHAETAISAT